jgi:hypothetical protein
LAKVSLAATRAALSVATGIPLIWLGAPSAKQRQNWGFLCRVFAKLMPKQIEIDEFCNRKFATTGRRL